MITLCRRLQYISGLLRCGPCLRNTSGRNYVCTLHSSRTHLGFMTLWSYHGVFHPVKIWLVNLAHSRAVQKLFRRLGLYASLHQSILINSQMVAKKTASRCTVKGGRQSDYRVYSLTSLQKSLENFHGYSEPSQTSVRSEVSLLVPVLAV